MVPFALLDFAFCMFGRKQGAIAQEQAITPEESYFRFLLERYERRPGPAAWQLDDSHSSDRLSAIVDLPC